MIKVPEIAKDKLVHSYWSDSLFWFFIFFFILINWGLNDPLLQGYQVATALGILIFAAFGNERWQRYQNERLGYKKHAIELADVWWSVKKPLIHSVALFIIT
jgi:hypothetical protein